MNIHRETMKQHRETRLDRGAWSEVGEGWPEYLLLERGHNIAYPGMTISPKGGKSWYCLEGHVIVLGQTGGYWAAQGTSRQTVIGQRDGWWHAFGNSRQVVIGQRQGRWHAWDTSRQTVIGQCERAAYDKSEQVTLKPKD